MAMGITFIFTKDKVYYEEQKAFSVKDRVIKDSYGRAKEEDFLAGSFTEDYVIKQI